MRKHDIVRESFNFILFLFYFLLLYFLNDNGVRDLMPRDMYTPLLDNPTSILFFILFIVVFTQ